MRSTTILLFGLAGLLSAAAQLRAAEAASIVDRNRVTLGEDFRVKILVRKSAGKPLVQPPKVPGCRIELLGTSQANTGPSTVRVPSPTQRRPGNVTNITPLIEAIGKMETETQRALADQAAKQGVPGTGLDQNAFDMLKATRQQAMAALQQGPSGNEYQTVFRITPERAGLLTLPSFLIEVDGKTLLTKPIEVTVDEPQAAATLTPGMPSPAATDKPTTAATPTKPGNITLPPAYAAAELEGTKTAPTAYWPWLAAILAGPFALAFTIFALGRLRRSRSQTAPQRAQRRAMSAARRQLRQRLRTGAAPEAIGDAFTAYVRHRFALQPGEITPYEAARALESHGVSAELADRCGELLSACAESRFAPGGVAVASRDLVAQARELVQHLDRMGR